MKTRYRRQPLAAATTLFLLAMAMPAAAQSVWTGAVDDDWFKAGNWQDVAVPDDTSEVFINTSTPAPIIEGILASVGNIVVANDAGSNAGLTIRNGGALIAGGVLIGNSSATGVATVGALGSLNVANSLAVGVSGNGTLNILNGGAVETDSMVIGASELLLVGNPAASIGLVTVDGLGSTLKFTGADDESSLTIGDDGNGTLNILSGGRVESQSSLIASRAGSTGFVTVDGDDSTWSASALTIGNAGNGTLNILNGSNVESASGSIGRLAGSTGLVTVDGDGFSTWLNDTAIFIGEEGDGTLNILGGGLVQTAVSIIGSSAGSTGLVTINGAGAALNAEIALIVGDVGNGTLNIFNGGKEESQASVIGQVEGSTGLVTVDGANSIWKNTGSLFVGLEGDGKLTVSNGGIVESAGASIGDLTGSTGSVVVDGANSIWTNETALFVGSDGNGTLSIRNGGSVENVNAIIGLSDASTGAVTVEGAGTTWRHTGDLTIGQAGSGTLTIADGGAVNNVQGFIGLFLNSQGRASAVTVTGADSSWTNSDNLFVGTNGVGTLTIADGGSVSNGGGFIGNLLGSQGTVTVTGANSTWTNARGIFVGHLGTGTLTIADGGKVASGLDSSIGEFDTSIGVVTVDGAGSTWSNVALNGGQVSIGGAGNGSLNILGGGNVESIFGSIADQEGSVGHVTVDGVGSTWSTDELGVGFAGNGSLDIRNGGVIQSNDSAIAFSTEAIGVATVDGAGSTWSNAGILEIGSSGNGALNIFNGGLVELLGIGSIGTEAGSIGIVTVDGVGSRFLMSDLADGGLRVGDEGSGTLVIRGGGLVRSGADGASNFVARGDGSTGTVIVDGLGSTWVSGGDLEVGSSGAGTLIISNGGLVTGGQVILGSEVDSSGSLFIGGGLGEAALAAGTLDMARVVFGSNASSLNFNHTGNIDGSDVVFAADINGDGGAINHTGSGTTVLTGNSSGLSGVTVSGGELRVDGSLTDLQGIIEVSTGGTLAGAGTVRSVAVVGGTLRGVQGQTLTIDGDLLLNAESTVSVALGAAGGSGLFHVNNVFFLDGTLQVTDLGGFGAGVYRLFDYDGLFFNDGLDIGTSPGNVPVSDLSIQTSVAQQVNLVSLGGQTLNFWDGGDQSLHQNGVVDGGTGTWQASDSANWTVADGSVNGDQRPQPGFAIFQGSAGIVTVDDTVGAISATGLQFASNGYRLEGDALELTEAQSVIRVGDGSAASNTYAATIANALTGGGLAKTDLGTLVLSGQNTYAGGTLIRDGVLQLGEGGTTGSIVGNVINDGVLAFNRSDDVVFAGAISGSGHVRQQGSGATILTGNNTHTGGTTIASGLLQVGEGGTTGSLTGNVINNATLAFSRSDSSTFAGAISGTGAVRQAGSGATILTGFNTHTGGTTIDAGTLQIGNGGTTGVLISNVANAGTLVFNRSDSSILAGLISGTGDVQQRGTGTTTLFGNHTYTGATTVAAGTLAISGLSSIAASSLTTVNVGARLQGTGTVGNTLVRGTIGPGNSIGTLTVQGDYTQAGAATYTAELGAGTSSDLLHVTGTATLQTGALLHTQRLAGTPVTAGTRYTVLTADGGLTGRYTLLNNTLSAFLGANAVYDATHAFLDVAQTRSFASVAQSRNQIATANGVERLGTGQPVFDAVLNLADEAQARAAFDQLSGELHASTTGALLEEGRVVRDATQNRLRTVADDDLAPTSWGQLYGSWGNSDSDSNAGERDVGRGGVLLGRDIAMGAARFGVIGGTGRTSVQVDDRHSKADSDSWHLGMYGGTQYGAWGFRGGVAYSGHDVETTRQVRFTGLDQNLRANYDVRTAQAFAEVGYGIEAGNARYEPFANLATISARNGSFTERGGSAALHGEQTTTQITFATLGVRAESAFKQGDHTVRLHGTLGWQHGLGDEVPTTEVNFAGGQAFTIAGAPIARDAAVLEAGVDLQLGQRTTLGLSYSGQLADDAHEHSAQAQLQVKF